MNFIEKKKTVEERVIVKYEQMTHAERLIMYKYLYAQGIRVANIEHEIEKALKEFEP